MLFLVALGRSQLWTADFCCHQYAAPKSTNYVTNAFASKSLSQSSKIISPRFINKIVNLNGWNGKNWLFQEIRYIIHFDQNQNYVSFFWEVENSMRWFYEFWVHKSWIVYLLLFFIKIFFDFFVKNKWLFRQYIFVILKRKSILRRSKQEASLSKNIQDLWKQDSWHHLMSRSDFIFLSHRNSLNSQFLSLTS